MAELVIFHKGETVLLTCEGRTVEATVRLASPNGMALFVEFEAIVGHFIGMMPLRWTEDGYRSLFMDSVVQLERKPWPKTTH